MSTYTNQFNSAAESQHIAFSVIKLKALFQRQVEFHVNGDAIE